MLVPLELRHQGADLGHGSSAGRAELMDHQRGGAHGQLHRFTGVRSGGQGGAKDVVVYSVTVTYPRLFPVAKLIGLSENVKLNATTVLANQPYGDQENLSGSLDPKDCT